MFCTSCGAAKSETDINCPKCGAQSQSPVPQNEFQAPNSLVASTPNPVNSFSVNSGTSRSKKVLMPAICVAAGLVVGTVLAAVGATEFATGDRFTSKELKAAQEISRKSGYEAGNSDGYDQGYESGYDSGYDGGYGYGYDSGECSVFDEIGDNLIAIGYPFYKLSVYGNYYHRSWFGC